MVDLLEFALPVRHWFAMMIHALVIIERGNS